ncbi:pyridoxamine 5'-phosphate oxidase family protein [Streptomyces sp. NPDC101165]|uniref:pyridoxamine 5'-phosphate oxidase family protein n=1 Tax=Streptomyces sp. NPDC101165 TaxID=3366119 RepID=UPI00380C0BD7
MFPDDGFRELARHECLRLMAKAPVGRIVYTRQALPAVSPVNFSLEADGAVVLRAPAALDLARAVDGAVVAFEADDVDTARQSGWSVVITGSATVVTDPAEHDGLTRTGPVSWAPASEEVFIRIEPELVTGRELLGGRAGYGVDHGPRWFPGPPGSCAAC